MRARIIAARRHGLEVFRAELWCAGALIRTAQFMSEAGARQWLASALRKLGA